MMPAREIVIDDLVTPAVTPALATAMAFSGAVGGELSVDAVLNAARARTGLHDFGPIDFIQRLAVLIHDYETDAEMTQLGRQTMLGDLVRYASNRLLIEEELKRDPQIAEERIEAPIIVAGLPRSGTTHLHNILAANPQLRSVPLWEGQEPVPLPGDCAAGAVAERDGVATKDARWRRAAARWSMMQRLAPHLAAMHPMDADHAHEDMELMAPDFSSFLFEWTGCVPHYRSLVKDIDHTPHYLYLRKTLQLLQRRRPAGRWVLKCTQHLEHLPILRNVFPDATIVIVYRDPVSILQSLLTMLAYSQRLTHRQVDTRRLAQHWVVRLEDMLRSFVRDYDGLDPGRIVDCHFVAFMRDNAAMVEKIYATAGLCMSERVRDCSDGYIAAHPRGKDGRVIYQLEKQFGLAPAELRERFRFYTGRFDVASEKIS